jgi:hypothetical protein
MAVCLGKLCQFRCMRCVYPTRYPLPLISLTQVIHFTETLGSPGPIGIREKGLSECQSFIIRYPNSRKSENPMDDSNVKISYVSRFKMVHLSHFKLILISPHIRRNGVSPELRCTWCPGGGTAPPVVNPVTPRNSSVPYCPQPLGWDKKVPLD